MESTALLYLSVNQHNSHQEQAVNNNSHILSFFSPLLLIRILLFNITIIKLRNNAIQ